MVVTNSFLESLLRAGLTPAPILVFLPGPAGVGTSLDLGPVAIPANGVLVVVVQFDADTGAGAGSVIWTGASAAESRLYYSTTAGVVNTDTVHDLTGSENTGHFTESWANSVPFRSYYALLS
jgi:hypothetical protein